MSPPAGRPPVVRPRDGPAISPPPEIAGPLPFPGPAASRVSTSCTAPIRAPCPRVVRTRRRPSEGAPLGGHVGRSGGRLARRLSGQGESTTPTTSLRDPLGTGEVPTTCPTILQTARRPDRPARSHSTGPKASRGLGPSARQGRRSEAVRGGLGDRHRPCPVHPQLRKGELIGGQPVPPRLGRPRLTRSPSAGSAGLLSFHDVAVWLY